MNPFDAVDHELLEAVEEISAQCGVNDLLMKCIIMTESAFDHLAVRYEPGYKYIQKTKERKNHAKNCNISLATETRLQMFSYGLCQIMGAVLRDELGFTDPLIHAFDPEINIELGCKFVASKVRKYDNNIDHVLASYNGGHGAVLYHKRYGRYPSYVQPYLNKVKSHMKHLT